MTYREGIERVFGQTMEMQEACKFLYKLREFRPVIAGGALWSWAAGRRPNDIDIFIGDYEGRARVALELAFEKNEHGSDSLAEKPKNVQVYHRHNFEGEYEIHRFRHKIEIGDQTVGASGYAVPVDLVVTPWNKDDAIWHFDYNHCRVAFGATTRNLFGAEAYAKGILMTQHSRPRPEERIRSKLQPSLWGNPDALPRLQMVMEQLEGIYRNICLDADLPRILNKETQP